MEYEPVVVENVELRRQNKAITDQSLKTLLFAVCRYNG